MQFYLSYPWLGLVLLLATLGIAVWLRLRALDPRSLSGAIRVLALAVSLLAIALPYIHATAGAPRIVLLVDESPSMHPYIPHMVRQIREMSGDFPAGSKVDVLGFSDTERVVAEGVEPSDCEGLDLVSWGKGASTPYDALSSAYSRIPHDTGGVVIVITDALFQAFDAPEPPGRVALRVISPPPVRTLDTGISRVDLPALIPTAAPVTALVTVFSDYETNAELTVLVGGRASQRAALYLRPGSRRISLEIAFDTPGIAGVEVRLLPEGPDSFPFNNVHTSSIRVGNEEKVAVLYDGADDRPITEWLAALVPGGVAMGISDFPADASGAVLVNIPLMSVPQGLEQRVAAGLPLVVVGGPSTLGREWGDSRLGSLLPVTPVPSDDRATDVVLLIDKSGSLDNPSGVEGLTCFDVVKRAAIAMLAMATGKTRFSVVAFDREPAVVLPLDGYGEYSSRAQAQSAIASLLPAGGTDLGKALSSAAEILKTSNAEKRYVVLVSDGESAAGDLEGPASRLAELGISLVFVGVGEVDMSTVSSVVGWSSGEYRALDPGAWDRLPAMLKELMGEFSGSGVLRGDFKARLTKTGVVALGTTSPGDGLTITALNNVEARPGAFVLAESRDGAHPLLTVTTTGIQRTGVLASLPSQGWMPSWDTPELTQMLSSFLSLVLMSRSRGAELKLRNFPGGSYLVAEVVDSDGSPLLNARVSAILDATTELPLRSFDRGLYRAPYQSDGEPRLLSLAVNGAMAGSFVIGPEDRPEPVSQAVRASTLTAFAHAAGGEFVSDRLNVPAAVPGWFAPLGWLAVLLLVLLVLEQLVGVPVVRRSLAHALHR